MKVLSLAVVASAAVLLGGCPDPYYYYRRPVVYGPPAPVVPAYPYYTPANCDYYYDTPDGPVCARAHPTYGYVYTGGPGVVVGAPAIGVRIGGGGRWRRWH